MGSTIICDFCGLPVVPFGGEDLCECPNENEREGDLDNTLDEWGDDPAGDHNV